MPLFQYLSCTPRISINLGMLFICTNFGLAFHIHIYNYFRIRIPYIFINLGICILYTKFKYLLTTYMPNPKTLGSIHHCVPSWHTTPASIFTNNLLTKYQNHGFTTPQCVNPTRHTDLYNITKFYGYHKPSFTNTTIT